MCRYIYYLTVGFFTFAISFSVYVVWQTSISKNDDFKRAEKKAFLEKTFKQIESTEKASKTNKNFKCENQYSLTVWNHLKKDKDYQELFREENKITDCSEVFGIGGAVDLNNNGDKEIVITDNGWLGGVFNASFWIVRKVGNDYKIILAGWGVEYEPKTQSTNGFIDIKVTTKWHDGERILRIYQFNGSNYVPKKCYVEYTWILKNDEKIELEKPMNSRAPCH